MINTPYIWAIHNGSSIRERNALFNNCRFVHLFKDCDQSGRMFWHGMIGTRQDDQSGFSDSRAKTRKELLALYGKLCPNLRVIAEHGSEFRVMQSGNAELLAIN